MEPEALLTLGSVSGFPSPAQNKTTEHFIYSSVSTGGSLWVAQTQRELWTECSDPLGFYFVVSDCDTQIFVYVFIYHSSSALDVLRNTTADRKVLSDV